MEGFFKRLEKYIKVRPTAALTDVIVKIMVEVISILGIVTKEIKQGKLSMSFRVDIPAKANLPRREVFQEVGRDQGCRGCASAAE
jgi:hypothetical protein